MNVVKKDGSKENFDKNKITNGCKKAGASDDVAEKVANAVGNKVKDGITTREIGEIVIAELRNLDKKSASSFEEYFRSH